MFKSQYLTEEQKKELARLKQSFSEVRKYFPLTKGFWVSKPSEGFCGVYDLCKFRKILDFSFGIPGLPHFTLKREEFYPQARSLTGNLAKKGLETTLELEYTKPKLVLKPQW